MCMFSEVIVFENEMLRVLLFGPGNNWKSQTPSGVDLFPSVLEYLGRKMADGSSVWLQEMPRKKAQENSLSTSNFSSFLLMDIFSLPRK